jgi:hypothetical protein
MVLVGLTVLILARACRLDGWGGVRLAGVRLPGVCVFHALTGIDCPGCGMTRAFVCLAHGQWARACRFHPLGPLVFLLMLLAVARDLLAVCAPATWAARWTAAACRRGLEWCVVGLLLVGGWRLAVGVPRVLGWIADDVAPRGWRATLGLTLCAILIQGGVKNRSTGSNQLRTGERPDGPHAV